MVNEGRAEVVMGGSPKTVLIAGFGQIPEWPGWKDTGGALLSVTEIVAFKEELQPAEEIDRGVVRIGRALPGSGTTERVSLKFIAQEFPSN